MKNIPIETVLDAHRAFQRAMSLQDMKIVVEKFPYMIEPEFIQMIEKYIKDRVPNEYKQAYEQHLMWLRQIAGK